MWYCNIIHLTPTTHTGQVFIPARPRSHYVPKEIISGCVPIFLTTAFSLRNVSSHCLGVFVQLTHLSVHPQAPGGDDSNHLEIIIEMILIENTFLFILCHLIDNNEKRINGGCPLHYSLECLDFDFSCHTIQMNESMLDPF